MTRRWDDLKSGQAMYSWYHSRGCHNAVKITQRWSDGQACKDEWGHGCSQLCDGLPAQTQSSKPVTAWDSCVTAYDSLPGWQTPAASSQSLRRVRPGEVAWPVQWPGRHRMLTWDWCSVTRGQYHLKRDDGVWLWACVKCACSVVLCFWTYLFMEERFCEIKIPLLMEYWSGKVLKRATSGRLQTVRCLRWWWQ